MMRCSTRRTGRARLGSVLMLAGIVALLPSAVIAGEMSVSTAVPVGDYQVLAGAGGDEVTVDGYGYLLVPGKPKLPARIFAIELPPGAEVSGISYELGEGIELPGTYKIAPAPLTRVVGVEDAELYAADLAKYEQNRATIYESDAGYPSVAAEFVRRAGYRGHNLVDVRVMPFTYHPVSGRLIYYQDITVAVQYSTPKGPITPVVDNLVATEQIAREIILNYQPSTDAPALGRGTHDFVIITLDSLTTSIASLVNWETTKGRTVEVVTTSWINSNYSGYDLAEKMRNFLREKYPSSEWGIMDVLLIGGYDDVPMRRTAIDVGYGRPETDYYYAELSLTDSESWDADGDHQYGEYTVDPIDFYTEVNVGRIPWSNSNTVMNICMKSVAYEQNSDPAFKKNILLLGGYFWADTDNAELMEAKVAQSWMSDWTMTRMYEQNSDYWSSFGCDYPLNHTNVMGVWPLGRFAFVNWAGHGSPTSCHIYGLGAPAFISTSDCPSLNDNYPAIIFADACSNSDTDYTNLGQAMLQRGAVGFVGATKVAYGCPGWNSPYDGSSQSMDYFFTTYVTSGEYTQGGGHQRALREMYSYGLWGDLRYEMFEWGALWGNPNLGMSSPPAITIALASELPEYVDPDVETVLEVRILDGMETYVEGSGALYYRFDGGAFESVALTPLGDDLYQATLPGAGCQDQPQFYFSASGDGGSNVTEPYGAPNELYAVSIGQMDVLFADDFETDLGWSVSGNAADGMWDRGVPVGGGDRGDPPTDYDGSGQCYLTDNVDDNSDVDDGYTYLDSPTIDLSAGDADIQFALWYSNNFGGDPNNDLFKIYVSNSNGANWTLVETIGPQGSGGWSIHAFTVGDFVTPNDQIRVRFEASDLNSGSVVEAGIDAFEVSVFSCEEAYCFGDLDGDNDIDLSDLSQMLSNYGTAGGAEYEDGDLDGDGDVDLSDLSALLSVYGTSCP